MSVNRVINAAICLKRMTYDQFYNKINEEDKNYYKVNDGVYIDTETWETVLIYNPNNIISKHHNPISNEFNIWDKTIDFN